MEGMNCLPSAGKPEVLPRAEKAELLPSAEKRAKAKTFFYPLRKKKKKCKR